MGLLTVAFANPAPAQRVDASDTPARPNILWITAEDLSPNLGCYGDPDARTPNLDRFATQAVRYNRAFATNPVCSPSRSCLVTGLYATSLGTQRLRSLFPIPPAFRGFPALLREAGYFTTNQVKTDYNIASEQPFIEDCWDRQGNTADWRQRPTPATPFFSVINLMVTHQSRTSAWPDEQFEAEVGATLEKAERHDPSLVRVPPFYPDIPSARRALARYHDCVTALDHQVQEILDRLETDGLSRNTIVFFFGDHGMGMPRGKRVLHDTGLRVPLLIRFPESLRTLAPGDPGSDTDRLVSFVDFAPAVLSLAGLDAPERMQGTAFLGQQAGSPRERVHGARDRVDEAIDLSRSVRDDRYVYIRNFMPHLSWMPPERYSDTSPLRQDMKRMRAEGTLGPLPLTYAAPRRAAEELYDCEADPQQMRNLAASPEHQEVLQRMRRQVIDWCVATRDAGFLPESDAWRRLGEGPFDSVYELMRDAHAVPMERIIGTAAAVGRPEGIGVVQEAIQDPDPAVRFWGVIGLEAQDVEKPGRLDLLRSLLGDAAPSVRIEAGTALAAAGDRAALNVLVEALQSEAPEDVLHAMRGLELSGLAGAEQRETIAALRDRAQAAEQAPTANPCWLFVRFSAEAAIENIDATGPDASAGPAAQRGPERWESAIAAFEAADHAAPPVPVEVLFVGSSSIKRWESLERDFPRKKVLNRGFGGSQLSDVLAYVDRVIVPYEPGSIVLYAGDNDLANGRTPEQIRDDLAELLARLREAGCDAPVYYLAIKPSPKRWAIVDQARRTNSLIAALSQADERLTLVDYFDEMLASDGQPRSKLYAEDGLHLSPAGYRVWRRHLRPLLRARVASGG